MRLRPRIPDSQLGALGRRILQINHRDADAPVIVSSMESANRCSVGRVLERGEARVSAIMDTAIDGARAVKIFLPEDAYVGEVKSCVAKGDQFTVELALIMLQDAENEPKRNVRSRAAAAL